MSKPNILVTFDSMKNPNSGYFSFGKGLGDALVAKNRGRFSLNFYMFKRTIYFFGGKVPVVYLSRLNNLFFPRRNDFDLVHFTDQTCRLRPYSVNAKRIMTIHDINNIHLKFKSQRKLDAHIRKLRRFISYCDRVVTISHFVGKDIVGFIPEAEQKLRVIHNGAEKLTVPEGHQPKYMPQKPFIFTIGLLSPQKGFHLLPSLLAGNDYEAVIAGIETPHKARILEEAEKYHCIDRVTITGPVSDDDKAWYYQQCSAFVFPSKAEGFGLPVIEAMYFGKPVFLSRFTSLPEIGGAVAYYFDNFEPEHMQLVFKKGMADYRKNARAAEIVAHAEQFSWEKCADEYLRLYQECLDN